MEASMKTRRAKSKRPLGGQYARFTGGLPPGGPCKHHDDSDATDENEKFLDHCRAKLDKLWRKRNEERKDEMEKRAKVIRDCLEEHRQEVKRLKEQGYTRQGYGRMKDRLKESLEAQEQMELWVEQITKTNGPLRGCEECGEVFYCWNQPWAENLKDKILQ